MVARQCQVCWEAQYKYKCPSCLLLYCSLACFKKHKESPCNKPATLQDEMTSMVLPGRAFEVEEANWVLSSEQLQCIAKSQSIRDALKQIDLQKMIYKIDSSIKPEEELDNAMEKEGFLKFTEMILSAVNPVDQTK